MNPRMRYILAAVCAVCTGLLTLIYLGGRSVAESETEVIWVARQALSPGMQLSEEMLQRVRVDSPTRQLLAREVLPTSPVESPGQWYVTGAIAVGQPLVPGRNVSNQPAPSLPEGVTAADLRLVTLSVDVMPSGTPTPGEEVDIYVIPEQGGEASQILVKTRVMILEDDLIAVLVPDSLVSPVLTAAQGARVKVVRRLPGAAS